MSSWTSWGSRCSWPERSLRALSVVVVGALLLATHAALAQVDSAAVAPASSGRPLVAVVMEIEGRVRARSSESGEWKPLKVNDQLRPGAEVQTGLRSTAALRLGVNATVLMDPGTTLVIPQLEEDAAALVTRLGVRRGRLDLRVDSTGLANDFQVITPSVTLAVSGTSLGVEVGGLTGSSVTGARLNLLRAIEVRWLSGQVFAFGDGTSSSLLADPALLALFEKLATMLLGDDPPDPEELERWLAQLRNAASMSPEIFNLDGIQRILNADSSAGILAAEFFAESAGLGLDALERIRDQSGVEAQRAGDAAVLAQAFAAQASQYANAAIALIPDIQKEIEFQTKIAESAAASASALKGLTISEALSAAAKKEETVDALANTIFWLDKDFKAAMFYANLASASAAMSAQFAANASVFSQASFAAAHDAAKAASAAQSAIDQFFVKVAGADQNAAGAAVQAQIASNAAATAQALNQLASQLGSAIGSASAASLLAQINSNTQNAINASSIAAVARDQALQAAQGARTMGEKMLFNHAAVFAAQAATDAASAAAAANQAALDALKAEGAAELAKSLVGDKGK
ncbi:MAG: FecR domain-containing protein [Phycisphaeraceae bacterium]|nr:FecR domain-containing protein [Phycisphaeraceae bacterium]